MINIFGGQRPAVVNGPLLNRRETQCSPYINQNVLFHRLSITIYNNLTTAYVLNVRSDLHNFNLELCPFPKGAETDRALRHNNLDLTFHT